MTPKSRVLARILIYQTTTLAGSAPAIEVARAIGLIVHGGTNEEDNTLDLWSGEGKLRVTFNVGVPGGNKIRRTYQSLAMPFDQRSSLLRRHSTKASVNSSASTT
jgi:hypothetical protein